MASVAFVLVVLPLLAPGPAVAVRSDLDLSEALGVDGGQEAAVAEDVRQHDGGNFAKAAGVAGSEGLELSAAARSQWNAYVSETQAAYAAHGSGIQAGCQPALYEPQGPYKGAVMLFHGFTACGQQFEQLVPLLTAGGYAVLVPLLPGHGTTSVRTKLVNAGSWYCPWCEKTELQEDFIDLIPDDYKEYQVFADRMNNIMAGAGGQTAVFGLSLGGAIAAYAGANLQYTRQMITAPMVQLGWGLDSLARFINWVTFKAAGRISIGWGEGCLKERKMGRAGLCNFKKKHVLAGRDLGSHHFRALHAPLPNAATGAVQFVFVEGDGAVSSYWVQELAAKSGAGKETPFVCGLDAAVGHSFLSSYDNPEQNKYWLNEVTSDVAKYLVTGTPLIQNGTIASERHWPRCQLLCTPESCPWTKN